MERLGLGHVVGIVSSPETTLGPRTINAPTISTLPEGRSLHPPAESDGAASSVQAEAEPPGEVPRGLPRRAPARSGRGGTTGAASGKWCLGSGM